MGGLAIKTAIFSPEPTRGWTIASSNLATSAGSRLARLPNGMPVKKGVEVFAESGCFMSATKSCQCHDFPPHSVWVRITIPYPARAHKLQDKL
jgi:hypothetical protein